MRSLLFTALSALGLIASVRSDTKFTNPATWDESADDRSNYQTYEVGDRIPIKWTTDLDRVSVAVWESGTDPFLWAWVDQNLTERSTTWKVDFGNGRFDTDIGAEHARFWFALYDPDLVKERSADGSESLVNSAAFNVTVPDYKPSSTTTTAEETTTSASTTETKTKTETPSTASTSSPAQSTESDAADKEEDKGLSAGAAAGIGVGASVGGIAILGAIGFFVWRHLKKRKEDQNQEPLQYHPETGYQPGQAPLQSPEIKAELPAQSTATTPSQIYEAP
ncbi:hypothetical protein ACHAPT_011743 [Fusarium lateritium]